MVNWHGGAELSRRLRRRAKLEFLRQASAWQTSREAKSLEYALLACFSRDGSGQPVLAKSTKQLYGVLKGSRT